MPARMLSNSSSASLLCRYLNERAAGNVAAQLRSLLPSVAQVIRDGKETSINAADLVAGDFLHMTIGSRVPADVKVVVSKDLKLDFSSLTGAPLHCVHCRACESTRTRVAAPLSRCVLTAAHMLHSAVMFARTPACSPSKRHLLSLHASLADASCAGRRERPHPDRHHRHRRRAA
jgi:P-type E1-E2 ATPase